MKFTQKNNEEITMVFDNIILFLNVLEQFAIRVTIFDIDVEDIIKDKYFLEVASAGVERPLVKLQDFERFLGREIKLKLKEPHNGKIGFKGKLIEVKGKEITIKSKNVQLIFAYDNIKGANLVLTDEEFRQLLKGIK